MKKWVIGAAMAAALVSTPARAAGCWSPVAVEAAQVRDFETMLMVSALRCRLVGTDFLPDYNRFIREKRAALTQVNDELRGQFRTMVGAAGALNAYDRYVTSIANSYGAGAEGLSCRDQQSLVAAANAQPATRAALVTIAQRASAAPRLPGTRCGVTVALKDRAK